MSTPSDRSQNSPSARIDEICRKFSEAWGRSPCPLIEEYLPKQSSEPDSTFAQAVLVQLIAIDLEKRWQLPATPEGADGPKWRLRLADYGARFRDLFGSDGPPEELICHEYYVRCRWGDRPGRDEYLAAYGRQHPNLQELLAVEDAELGIAETVPCADNSPSGPKEERRLAEGARAGEGLALQILLLRTYDRLLDHIQRQIPTELTGVVSASDVLQATHIQAFRSTGQFSGESGHTFRNWLTAVADSLLRNAVSAAVQKKSGQDGSQFG